MLTTRTDLILGFDPGLHGAVALLDTRHTLHPLTSVHDLPLTKGGGRSRTLDPEALADLIRALPGIGILSVRAQIELVCSRPGQQGAFAFGLSTGMIHGVLGALGIPFSLVAPQVWKPKMGLARVSPDELQASLKNRSRELASKLFPALAGKFSRVSDDGRAEALLIAYWAQIQQEKECLK